jgi:hypothetical protein
MLQEIDSEPVNALPDVGRKPDRLSVSVAVSVIQLAGPNLLIQQRDCRGEHVLPMAL